MPVNPLDRPIAPSPALQGGGAGSVGGNQPAMVPARTDAPKDVAKFKKAVTTPGSATAPGVAHSNSGNAAVANAAVSLNDHFKKLRKRIDYLSSTKNTGSLGYKEMLMLQADMHAFEVTFSVGTKVFFQVARNGQSLLQGQ